MAVERQRRDVENRDKQAPKKIFGNRCGTTHPSTGLPILDGRGTPMAKYHRIALTGRKGRRPHRSNFALHRGYGSILIVGCPRTIDQSCPTLPGRPLLKHR
jgi:hypothetical protein